MKLIKQGYEILDPEVLDKEAVDRIYRRIERAGRTCYKSEDKITDGSARKFVAGLVKRGHEAMIEHAGMTVRFITDRGISHEIVRHRIASFAQMSTRYCNYSDDKFGNEITLIDCRKYMETLTSDHDKAVVAYDAWKLSCEIAEKTYLKMIENGVKPEIARGVLPNSIMTEIVVTADMREWRNIFKLRTVGTTGRPHPMIVDLTAPLLQEVAGKMPELFGDLWDQYVGIRA